MSHLTLGEAEMNLLSLLVSQLGRLSGKCAGAGRLGPVVFLKECCNGCSSRAGSRR